MVSFQDTEDTDMDHPADYTIVQEEEDDDDDQSSEGSEEFNFASALQLRKNLTETFDQHVHSVSVSQKIAQLEASNKQTSSISSSSSSSSTSNSPHNAAMNKASSLHPTQKQSLQQSHSSSNNNSNNNNGNVNQKPPRHAQPPRVAPSVKRPATSMTANSNPVAAADTGRCLSVYLRIRPTKDTNTTNNNNNKDSDNTNDNPGNDSTIGIVHKDTTAQSSSSSSQTTIRTYPPPNSKAYKVVRDSQQQQVHSSSSDGQNNHTAIQHAVVKGIKEFEFEQVFGPESTQQDLYSTVAAPLVHGLFPSSSSSSKQLVGESALLFAYGITNAGKTYTIMGGGERAKKTSTANKPQWGIVPRALQDIFGHMEVLSSQTSHTHTKYALHLSYLEIYNEQIYDLLPKTTTNNSSKTRSKSSTSSATSSSGIHGAPPLKIREGKNGESFVRGLSKIRVKNVAHGLELARLAKTKRHTASNNINDESSRSHCICQLELVSVNEHINNAYDSGPNDFDSVVSVSSQGYNTDEVAANLRIERHTKATTLWIVDLAGSERSKRTIQSGGSMSNINTNNITRQKEAALINSSLMKLMRCLAVMRDNNTNHNSNVVPFRESKLTHLLMNHLNSPSGQSGTRTCMVVNVNPNSNDFDETQHVLSYAVAAKSVVLPVNGAEYQTKYGTEVGSSSSPTHGYNGRPLAKHKSSNNGTGSKNRFARLVKQFSPKKWTKKPDKRKNPCSSSSNNSNSKDGASDHALEHRTKMRRLGETRTATSTATTTIRTTGGVMTRSGNRNIIRPATTIAATDSRKTNHHNSNEQEIKIVKNCLLAVKADNIALRVEKERLEEELVQMEEQVRMEVAEETDEQMEQMREQYNFTIGRLKEKLAAGGSSDPTMGHNKSAKKARADKASKAIEELMDKVDECEEEMVRMRKEYEMEIGRMLKQASTRENEVQIARNEFEQTCRTFKETVTRLERQNQSLNKELKFQSQQAEASISNKQVRRRTDTRLFSTSSSSSNSTYQDTENLPPSYTNSKKKTKKNTSQKKGGSNNQSNKSCTRRIPFASIIQNKEEDLLSEIDSDENNQSDDENEGNSNSNLLYPKQPSVLDDRGIYPRPRGRAPTQRMWDGKIGAWRLSSVV